MSLKAFLRPLWRSYKWQFRLLALVTGGVFMGIVLFLRLGGFFYYPSEKTPTKIYQVPPRNRVSTQEANPTGAIVNPDHDSPPLPTVGHDPNPSASFAATIDIGEESPGTLASNSDSVEVKCRGEGTL